MPIIKEWRCNDCGTYFESADRDPFCPACATQEDPERVFLTPPAIRSGDTSVKDEMVKGLAADFGLSDLRSNKHGEAVARRPSPPAGQAPQFAATDSPVLGRIPANARDGFSAVLHQIKDRGPRTWDRKPERK